MSIAVETAVFDGTNFEQSAGGLLRLSLRIVHGLDDGLQVRGTDNTIPSLDGQVPRIRVAHQRIIEIEGYAFGTGANETAQRNDMVDLLDELAALFDPTKMPQTLTVTRMDGSTRSIEARPLDDLIVTDVVSVPACRAIAVSLLSVDPNWTTGGS